MAHRLRPTFDEINQLLAGSGDAARAGDWATSDHALKTAGEMICLLVADLLRNLRGIIGDSSNN
jgi:hypothetical protein